MQITKVRRFKIKLIDGSFVKTKCGDDFRNEGVD
jgi:hypothetical protein